MSIPAKCVNCGEIIFLGPCLELFDNSFFCNDCEIKESDGWDDSFTEEECEHKESNDGK